MAAIKRPLKIFGFIIGFLLNLSIAYYNRFLVLPFVFLILASATGTFFTMVRVFTRKFFLESLINITKKCYTLKIKLSILTWRQIVDYIPGFVLILIGLVFYISSQKKSSYWIYHSFWHICISLAIVFFLPKGPHKSRDDYKVIFVYFILLL